MERQTGSLVSVLALLVLMLGVFSPKAWAQDPVAFWQMDEGQWSGDAGEVIDSSGNGNNGTARTAGSSNSFPDTIDAKVCRGGWFRGQGYVEGGVYNDAQHYVEIPDSNELSPLATTAEMSISGWVRLDDRSGTQTVVHKGGGGQSQEYNVSFENGRLTLTLWNRYGSATSLRLNSRVSEGQWYFFWVQASRSSFFNVLYPVDFQVALLDDSGNVVASNGDTDWTSFDSDYTNKPFNTPLIIGGTRYGSGNPTSFLNGTLDELYIHDTELSTNEAQDLALNTRPCLSPEPLTCASDAFSGAALSEDWVTSVSGGQFTPQIVNGRLRLTEDVGNQATAATYQRVFPGADNLIRVEFDYYAYDDSTGADGIAVVFSDASVTPQAGGYGGSLGYAQAPDGSGGFAGGWLGIGLDEYGNFSNDSEGREGGNNGRTLDSVAVRGAAPDYAFIADTGELQPGIDANNDNNPYRYRITIDSLNGKTPVLTVERNGRGTGNSYELLIQETLTGQPVIPENLFLSLTGSTGGSTNIHELDNLEICADKVGSVQNLVDHFEIEHGGTGLTCSPQEVTIRACDNVDCSQLFPDPVEVTLAPTGWVGGDTFTFTGEATPSLRVTTPQTVTLGVASSVPGSVAFSQTLCDNGTSGLAPTNCDMTFFDSGFDISIPDHISDTTVSASIAAVRKDDIAEQCVPEFSSETKLVALWSNYVNPSSGTRSLFVEGNALEDSPGATTPLQFDGNGVATVGVRYPDVGRMRLNARYEGSGEDAGLVMVGDGAFVVRPDHFELDIPGNPAATTVQDGNDFVSAGTDFEIRVSSINASGNVTPNFGRETPAEAVALESSLVAPGGGDSPPLSGAFGAFGEDCSGDAITGGTACGQFQWPEVGIIRITPSLVSENYLGTADVAGDPISHVGRFIPDRFNVIVAERGEVEPFCTVSTAFAYAGQDLNWQAGLEPRLTLEALNANGTLTRNYTLGDFQRLTTGSLSRSPSSSDLAAVDTLGNSFPVSANLDPPGLAVIERGRLQYQFSSSDQINYTKTTQSRVPPFTPNYRISLIGLMDADGVSSPQLPVAIDPNFAFEMMYGRLQMENAYGPETSNLQIPFRAEYFTANGFTLNTADSCWLYNTATTVTLDQSGLSGGSTSVVAASGSLEAGIPVPGNELILSAPGEGNRGNVRATFSVPLWLRGDFSEDGALEDPSALATFGVYRGNDRIIYWQEVLN
ncbi:MAG: DUF6701 domain-containing protein [Marinobacter sp.]